MNINREILESEGEMFRAISDFNQAIAVARLRRQVEINQFELGQDLHGSLTYIDSRYAMASKEAQLQLVYSLNCGV